jgi:hypothetical protein
MTSQIVFIDSRTPDIDDLINGAEAGEQIFVLDPAQDGLQQIAAILKANHLSALSVISIVGHGAPGQITLGSTLVDDADLANDTAALATIGAALAPGGNLALYACDTAAGATGRQFIADLSKSIGGADVVASTHVVGSADLGGSWTLDASTLSTAALPAVPFTAQALANYEGGLGPVLVTTATPSVVFTAGGNAVALDPALTLSDSDDATLASATVSIASGFRSGDTLNFTNQSGITGSYDATHGVLTLSGTSSLALYQTALESITYKYSGGNTDPTAGGSDTSRTIDWVISDGMTNSNTPTTVTLHQTNAQPSLGLNQLLVEQGSVPDATLQHYTTDSGGIPEAAIRTFAGSLVDHPWGGTAPACGTSAVRR